MIIIVIIKQNRRQKNRGKTKRALKIMKILIFTYVSMLMQRRSILGALIFSWSAVLRFVDLWKISRSVARHFSQWVQIGKKIR